MQETVYRFGRFVLDTRAHTLLRDGVKLSVQEQPFQVLLALLEKPTEVVSRQTLHRRLWGTSTFVDFDQSLNSAVRRLRVVLGDNSRRPVYIETIPRLGFRFLPTVNADPAPMYEMQATTKPLSNGHLASLPPQNELSKAPGTAVRFPMRGIASGFLLMLLGMHGGHTTTRLQRVIANHGRFKSRLFGPQEAGITLAQH